MARHRKAPRATAILVRQAVALVFLSLAIFLAVFLVAIPRLLGAEGITVLTNSMAPKYPPGTFLVVEPASAESLQIGEIITYQLESGQPDLVTHRIVGFGTTQSGETTYITRGDNNDAADEQAVLDIQVQGELLYAVPWVGHAATFAGRSRESVIPWLAAALLIYGAVTFVRGVLAWRARRTARAQLRKSRSAKEQEALCQEPPVERVVSNGAGSDLHRFSQYCRGELSYAADVRTPAGILRADVVEPGQRRREPVHSG